MSLDGPVRVTLLVFEVEMRKGSSPGFFLSLSEDWGGLQNGKNVDGGRKISFLFDRIHFVATVGSLSQRVSCYVK